MNERNDYTQEIETIRELVSEGRIDDAVKKIAYYLNLGPEDEYIDRLENIIETVLTLHGGRTVLRFLIENMIIDIPSLLENLSKKDSVLRYSFLLLLKSMCENEFDLFLPYIEDLLQSDDPNVKEAALQLIIFIAGGDKKITEESKVHAVADKLSDEKDFVIEKAIQAMKAIGKDSPSLITNILKDYAKEFSEDETLKNNIDNVLKSIVSVEKIDEIVEEEKTKEKEESIIKEEKKKEAKDESDEEVEEDEDEPEVIDEELEKEEKEIKTKEIELKKKDIELKKKKLELEEKEKQLEEKEIEEKEKALKKKEELLEKEKQLSQVELELRKKKVEEKEKKIKEEEAKRIMKKIKEIDEDSD
ncbi:MAG: hypothetical protein GF317_16860 [Candidatus Lokiarchaeota archaeon]|nr:hypothetical protein [Candidatus Lokiarchaeota archaeon]MBD3201189.1 hypothetical protein [Candidatus Lokiarchaeota archaeon]